MESLILKPMDGSFLLWRCLHDGAVTRKNLDVPPDESRLPFRRTAIPLLRRLTELYGSAAILAWEGDEVVGLLRFVPRVVDQMEGGGGFCLLQHHPAGPKEDFAQGVLPSEETIEDRTLVVTCMQLLSDRQRKGVGRAMVERLKSWAREEGWQAIEATAYQDLPLVYEITGNAGRSWWEGLGFHVRESLEEEAMKEYPDFLQSLEIQAREKGMDPGEVTRKFIVRWETQTKALRREGPGSDRRQTTRRGDRMGKTPDQVPEDKLELYRKLIDTQPDIELKGGLKLPHTSTNGYMFSSLTKDGRVGIRLSEPDREAFMEKYDAIPFKNYGANIREHVEVPDSLLRDPDELGPYLAMSYAYTQTLPPKADKKKRHSGG